jgi:Ca2+-binding RTX toxin-like protein
MVTVSGTINNDSILGAGNADDSLWGNDGDDTLRGGNSTTTTGGGADFLDGGAGADRIYGGLGNDTLIAGFDTVGDGLFGGSETDTADYSRYLTALSGAGVGTFVTNTTAVNVNLTTGLATGLGTDTLSSIENVLTGSGADTIVGGAGSNVLDAGAGADTLDGAAGTDTLFGQAGNDTLSGGVGIDRIFGGADADLAYGGADGDLVYGDAGADTLFGDAGVDTIFGGTEDDLIYGDSEGDTLAGDAGNDTIFGGLGADSAAGGAGNDLVIGEDGIDTLFGDGGDDTLRGGIGADVLNGSQGLDLADYSDSGVAVEVNLATGVYAFGTADGDSGTGIDGMIGSAFNDTLTGFDGFSSDPLDTYSNIIYGAAGDDIISGLAGPDTLYGGDNNDTVQGDTGDDHLYGDAGRDSVSGGAGSDTVYGGADADTVYGGADNDTVYGDAGNDSVFGDAGSDSIFGGIGLDTLYGGLGQDFVSGGDDQDLVQMSFTAALNDVLGSETVDGGSGGTDNDTLSVDITGFGWTRIDIAYTPGNDENGTITFFAADGSTVVGTLTFTDIENLVIVCFTAGTQILTERGAVAVEDLGPGDLVLTRDNGLQPLRWVGSRKLTYAELQARPELQPVRIAANALSGMGPERTMMVSPQHRVLMEGARAEMFFGESEVLVPAKHLTGLAEVTRALPVEGVTYVHILFDRHEIVQSDGLWTESFQPAERTLGALEEAARAEVLAIFPELANDVSIFPAARLSLKAHEARVLVAD